MVILFETQNSFYSLPFKPIFSIDDFESIDWSYFYGEFGTIKLASSSKYKLSDYICHNIESKK